ncbi:hypothetical protein HDU86_004894 [Geranomyces michiganensis]|nr:hypothetical protein HDU86_004894 [Geranomyces michiganensis]
MAPAAAQQTSQLVLSRLLAGKEQSPFIVVEDSVKQSAIPLVQKLAAAATQKRGPSEARRAVFVDVFSSYTLAPAAEHADIKTVTAATIGDHMESLVSSEGMTTVVFDSINPFALHHSLGVFARLLKRFAGLSDSLAFILPFHGDCVPRSVHSVLGDIAVTVLTVRHPRDFGVAVTGSLATDSGDAFRLVDANSPGGAVVEVMHKRKSGKITREVDVYFIDGDKWRLKTLEEVRGLEDLVEEKELTEDEVRKTAMRSFTSTSFGGLMVVPLLGQPDPTANLSFNLKLTDEQRAARSEVVLPFLHMQKADGAGSVQQHQMPQSAVPSAEAAIYYDDDDYDEEDPDADLDI